MNKKLLPVSLLLIFVLFLLAACRQAAEVAVSEEMPAADSDATAVMGPYDPPAVGIPDGYREFVGSYAFPNGSPQPPTDGYPWTNSLNGETITIDTAEAYINIVKEYITDDMITLLSDSGQTGSEPQWNAAAAGWYNEPWLSTIRDGIHGTYMGSNCFSTALFPQSKLPEPFTTYVLVYYNETAAYSLGKVWGDTAMSPNFMDNAAQFDEGSIIVKAALTTQTTPAWEPMDQALSWDIYTTPYDCAQNKPAANPETFTVDFFQFDIIVKDSQAAPKTSWVFSTLVYDKDVAVGNGDKSVADIWTQQMVPLGVMWGNDPEATQPDDPLEENWINPAAPIYATETLGWGGRLSGPNDGSVQNPPYFLCTGDGCNPETACADGNCQLVPEGGENLAMSSCMSCHSAAQYAMASFLLPLPLSKVSPEGQPVPLTYENSDKVGGLVFYEPASAEWMTWFQDRGGAEPKDQNNPQVIAAADYDMNLPFKSMLYWAQEVCVNQGNPGNSSVCNVLNNGQNALYWIELEDGMETNYQGFKIDK